MPALRKGYTMKTEAQKRAEMKYRRDKVKQVVVTFGPTDYDLFEWLAGQSSKAGYIKNLIREDMERSR